MNVVSIYTLSWSFYNYAFYVYVAENIIISKCLVDIGLVLIK